MLFVIALRFIHKLLRPANVTACPTNDRNDPFVSSRKTRRKYTTKYTTAQIVRVYIAILTSNNSGHNLEPNKSSIASEAIPKSVSRVLNALQIRKEWADKKRKLNGEDAGGGGQRKRQKVNRASDSKLAEGSNKGTSLKILPGESIQHFNKCVYISL